MADSGLLLHATAWHAIREKRNLLAHTLWNKCDWPVLQQAINTADDELRDLGMAGPKPVFEFFGERIPVEPTEPKVVLKFDYCYGLTVGGRKVIEVSWSTNHYGMAGPPTDSSSDS